MIQLDIGQHKKTIKVVFGLQKMDQNPEVGVMITSHGLMELGG